MTEIDRVFVSYIHKNHGVIKMAVPLDQESVFKLEQRGFRVDIYTREIGARFVIRAPNGVTMIGRVDTILISEGDGRFYLTDSGKFFSDYRRFV